MKYENGLNFLNNFKSTIDEYKNLQVYKTGLRLLDKNLSGGLRNFLYVLGAGSSMGKTSLVQQLADNIAKNGNHVLFFSMEQTVLELKSKGISRLTYQNDKKNALSHSEIMQGNLNDFVLDSIEDYKEYSDKLHYFEADFGTNLNDIMTTIIKFQKEHNTHPVIIIDYLQVLGYIEERDSDKRAVERNIKLLKLIAKKQRCPVIVLSSLNRDSYLTPISYESFKESGGIEYTCDCLLGLQYKKVNDLKEHKKVESRKILEGESINREIREIQLVCLKNRVGKQHFKIDLEYNPKFNNFTESPLNNFNEALKLVEL